MTAIQSLRFTYTMACVQRLLTDVADTSLTTTERNLAHAFIIRILNPQNDSRDFTQINGMPYTMDEIITDVYDGQLDFAIGLDALMALYDTRNVLSPSWKDFISSRSK